MTKKDTDKIISVLAGIIIVFTHTIVGIWCFAAGANDGRNEIYLRDHIQAKAGFFIDGYANNKLYRVTHIE